MLCVNETEKEVAIKFGRGCSKRGPQFPSLSLQKYCQKFAIFNMDYICLILIEQNRFA